MSKSQFFSDNTRAWGFAIDCELWNHAQVQGGKAVQLKKSVLLDLSLEKAAEAVVYEDVKRWYAEAMATLPGLGHSPTPSVESV